MNNVLCDINNNGWLRANSNKVFILVATKQNAFVNEYYNPLDYIYVWLVYDQNMLDDACTYVSVLV